MWSGRKEQESQAWLEKKESERKKRVSRRRRRRHSPRPLASVRASRSLRQSFGCFHGRHLVGSFTPRGARARKERGGGGERRQRGSGGNGSSARAERHREGERERAAREGWAARIKGARKRQRGTRRDTYVARTRRRARSGGTRERPTRGSNWRAECGPADRQTGRPADRRTGRPAEASTRTYTAGPATRFFAAFSPLS